MLTRSSLYHSTTWAIYSPYSILCLSSWPLYLSARNGNYMNAKTELLILGVAILSVFVIMIVFIIFFLILFQRNRQLNIKEKAQLQSNFQKELLTTQLETQEATFNKIGEELHDNIGQLLSSTRILIGITERSIPVVPDTLIKADETLATAIHDLRMLSKSLSKEWLSQFDLLENLQLHVNRINSGQRINLTLESSLRVIPLSSDYQVMLFRIIQEAIHNAIKHANAKSIIVQIQKATNLSIT
ncbi:MAG: hypothetical protein EOO00_07930, partial [Chitinophagaceae bacterium]